MNHLVFDLDGTISDPTEGIVNGLNHALLHHGYAAVTRERVRPLIGPPLDDAFKILTGSTELAHLSSLIASYRDYYGSKGLSENILYPGIPNALEFLYVKGRRMGICTSKRRDFAVSILNMFNLSHFFEFIDGGDIGITKTDQLRCLLDQRTIDVSSLMIGDRNVDILAARLNGMRSAGVLWGHGSDGELQRESPDYLFSRPEDLKDLSGAV